MSKQLLFETERPFLTQLAYRMLGSVQDAEDIVQEAFLRWHRNDARLPQEPRAWLTRVTTNLCIDRLRKVQAGPAYPGEWLPEPWVEPESKQQELDDTLSVALLSAIRRLTATERAVFLLHDVFDYEFSDVAAMLDLQVDNCRQLAGRARKHLTTTPPRQRDRTREQELGNAFFRALRDGDIDDLRALLREDVMMRSDGGGKVAAVHYPLIGRDSVLRFFDRLFLRPRLLASAELRECWFNCAPGYVLFRDGTVESAFQFDQRDGAIQAIHIQRNPDKLHAIAARVANAN